MNVSIFIYLSIYIFRQAIHPHEPVYQALWAANTDFDEVLISPVMIQDHMPDKVLEALNKVRSAPISTTASTQSLVHAEHQPIDTATVVRY